MFRYCSLKTSYNIPGVVVQTSEREQVELPLGVLHIHFLLFNRCSDSSLRPGQQSSRSVKSEVLNAMKQIDVKWRNLGLSKTGGGAFFQNPFLKEVMIRHHDFPLESFLVQQVWL